MERFQTRIDDGIFSIESGNGWLEIGPVAEIIEELGEIYILEYDDEASSVPWLDTDDGIIEIDVREQLETLSFDQEFVSTIADSEPRNRLAVFCQLIDHIWSTKGNIDLN